MHEPIVLVFYDNKLITPSPTLSYSTDFGYVGDLATGYQYSITLKGKCIAPSVSKYSNHQVSVDDPKQLNSETATIAKDMLEKMFSHNNKTLKITSNGWAIFAATGVKVKKIDFPGNIKSWGAYIEYSITLECEHLFVGPEVQPNLAAIELGQENLIISRNLQSSLAQPIENHKIATFSENFSMDTSEIINRNTIYNDDIELVNILGGDHIKITYTCSAEGKYDTVLSSQTQPAFQHAKKFVHLKLLEQMGGLFAAFMNMDAVQFRENLHSENGPGAFLEFQTNQYKIFNESFSFEVSESNGTFSVTYNAILKRPCDANAPTQKINLKYQESLQGNRYDNPPELYNPTEATEPDFSYPSIQGEPIFAAVGSVNSDEIGLVQGDTGCREDVMHTVQKTVNKTYNATEDRDIEMLDLDRDGILEGVVVNQDIEITINGSIEGLVYGGVGLSSAKLVINNLRQGTTSFLTYNPSSNLPGNDRYGAASQAFNAIFDYKKYDLNQNFKASLGITPSALAVSPTSTLAPSKMTVIRNHLEGKIDYSATYNNIYNCDPNNFDINLTVDYPVPVVAEFTVPNNNIKNAENIVCRGNRGYKVIQLLGTQTPKRINVSITANVGQDWNKCCFGTTDNWNLLDYNFFTLQNFIIPKGMQIPYISEDYVLLEKTKSVTYPRGNMSISLSYLCSDVCEIDDYFTADNNGPLQIQNQQTRIV